jgi:O-methyltransferase
MKIPYIVSQLSFAFTRVLHLVSFGFSRLLGISYQIVIPASTYAPWHKDKEFLKVFRVAKKNSLLNFYQGWELWKLAEQADKVEGDVIEVGVWRGSSTIMMASKLQRLNSKKHVYACDTFEGVVKSDSKFDNFYEDGEHKDTSFEFVDDLVKNTHGLKNVTLLKGIFPDDTQHLIADKKFSLCHIDVDTYVSGKEVMNWVWDRLSVGGMVVFNDYGFPMTKGITHLVNEYRKEDDKYVINNLNGHGIVVKIK